MNWILKNFLRGLVIVVPVAVTVYLIWQTFLILDRLLPFAIRGVGLIVLLVAITLVGALASSVVLRGVVRLTERLFTRAPIVRIVYSAVKDLLEAFVGDTRRFDRPVAVTVSEGVRTLGFVTQDDLAFLALPGSVAVYFPFSYSMSGTLLVVARERVMPLDADSASILALIVSGGISRV